jgi:hypothetical protein
MVDMRAVPTILCHLKHLWDRLVPGELVPGTLPLLLLRSLAPGGRRQLERDALRWNAIADAIAAILREA